jgi:superfamily II DNA/RNA helicase
MPFASLGLTSPLARVAADQGFVHPTPIQTAAIPAILQGRDVLGLAQTGSGKTAAFVLPLLQQVLGARRSTPRRLLVLILVPTRELADQVGGVTRELADGLGAPVKIVTAFGGVSINPQMMALRGGADIVVATPGRLLDLVQHNALNLDEVAALVLDEADRLLDLGFAAELAEILDLLPPQRQSLFFSATFADEVQALASALLHEPVRIEVPTEPETRPDITQRAIEVDPPKRAQLLKHLIQTSDWGPEARVLVFAATKYATELVAHKLHRAGIHAAAFHGDLSQGGRRDVLNAFRASELQVVVATDVAARGIDIAQLPVVVNFDLPRSPDDYIHRIGRTGRAGASGLAISFISPDTEAHFRLIEKRQGLRVPRERIAGFEPVPGELDEDGLPAAPQGLDPNGGVKGKRKSKKDKLREAAARGG